MEFLEAGDLGQVMVPRVPAEVSPIARPVAAPVVVLPSVVPVKNGLPWGRMIMGVLMLRAIIYFVGRMGRGK